MRGACYFGGMDFLRPVQSVIPGAMGRVLAALAEASGELSLRSLAKVAGVSAAQASRVLPGLVAIGLVERREVPPSSMFRLSPDHCAAGPLLDLSRARDRVLSEMGRRAACLGVPPVSVIVFGSFARGEADAMSDIDAVLVRPASVSEEDPEWWASLGEWSEALRRATGNPIEVLEVGVAEVAARLGSRRSVWQDIRRDGVVVHGLSLEDLAAGEASA